MEPITLPRSLSLTIGAQFTEDVVRFYAAEIAQGLHELQKVNVLYRDMKPENVLFDLSGHIKISDLGLAVRITPSKGAKGRAGTPGFMAPEQLNGERYGFGVDWWGLGCVVYEMIAGHSPFRRAHEKIKPEKLYERIVNANITFGERFSESAKSLCQGLLTCDPAQRLGVRGAGFDELRGHPFFAPLDWTRMKAGLVEPPWKPPVRRAAVAPAPRAAPMMQASRARA